MTDLVDSLRDELAMRMSYIEALKDDRERLNNIIGSYMDDITELKAEVERLKKELEETHILIKRNEYIEGVLEGERREKKRIKEIIFSIHHLKGFVCMISPTELLERIDKTEEPKTYSFDDVYCAMSKAELDKAEDNK